MIARGRSHFHYAGAIDWRAARASPGCHSPADFGTAELRAHFMPAGRVGPNESHWLCHASAAASSYIGDAPLFASTAAKLTADMFLVAKMPRRRRRVSFAYAIRPRAREVLPSPQQAASAAGRVTMPHAQIRTGLHDRYGRRPRDGHDMRRTARL